MVVHPYGGCCCGSCMNGAEEKGQGTTRWDWNFGVEKGGVVNTFEDQKEQKDGGEWLLREEGEYSSATL